MKIFFEMLYERPLIKREFASVSQLQEERSNIARSLWRAEWRQKQPCFYLFFDQRPRNYVIVVIRNVVSFTQLPHFRDENIQQTNRTRDDDIIIRIFETYWHYFLLSERLFVIKDRYLFFFETNRWRIQWNRAHSLSVWKSIFRIARGYFVMKSRKTSFFFLLRRWWNWFGSCVMIRQKFEILDFHVANICNSICEVTLLNFA